MSWWKSCRSRMQKEYDAARSRAASQNTASEPTPKKTKQWTKEEKILYKNLEEAFNTVANMANVIEERTMDVKNIPDLQGVKIHSAFSQYANPPYEEISLFLL